MELMPSFSTGAHWDPLIINKLLFTDIHVLYYILVPHQPQVTQLPKPLLIDWQSIAVEREAKVPRWKLIQWQRIEDDPVHRCPGMHMRGWTQFEILSGIFELLEFTAGVMWNLDQCTVEPLGPHNAYPSVDGPDYALWGGYGFTEVG